MLQFAKHIYHYFRALWYILLLKPPAVKGKKIILVINHFFDQDIAALKAAEDESSVHFFVIEPQKLFAPIISTFPHEIKFASIPYDDPTQTKNRRKASKISRYILKILLSKIPFDLILTPSDLYYWLREFIHTAKNQEIETIVLDKEGIISPHYYFHHAEKIKNLFPPISDQFIVWSDRQKSFWENVGISSSLIKVIGQPRSDLLFTLKKQDLGLFEDESRHQVLFFTYFENAYITPELEKEKGLSWRELRSSTHSQIKKLAELYPTTHFIVKCHPQQLDIDKIESFFAGVKNVIVLAGAESSNQLLINSSLVVGFQSTALIESIVLRKPTIYTFYTSDVKAFKEGILPFHEFDVFDIVQSETQLFDRISAYISSEFKSIPNEKSRNELLKLYFNDPDGDTGKKVISYLESILK
ncbi:CDP-glycerol glycerophosphotransferase family protein [Ekhidna sp.]|uniref:CDP-glycerol glycerophosphotransferase family protein n=1 Tax=Ekhidna sp. TaxID=2608089 RepID=UPI00329712CB